MTQKKIKLSYGITVCNEFVEIQRLISFLLENKRPEDEIVVLYDMNNGDQEIENYLRAKSVNGEFAWHKAKFENHFANWKNRLTQLCSGDYVFQIDADEEIPKSLMSYLPAVLESNIETEMFWVPRVNTVEGLTQEDIQRWRWNVDDKGRINWPDMQCRIYKKRQGILWKNKVHEQLEGFKSYTSLPLNEEWALIHHKHIDRQRKQNEYYSTL